MELTYQIPKAHTGASTPPPQDGNELRPTTEEILESCPQFRILVIGKSGAGKSSLINKTFGVTDAKVSDYSPGQADIDKEIISKENPRFLLHDSRGFEHGEGNNVKLVQQFIELRSKKPDIKDKLHAIWLCIEIPYAGGRLLEFAVEEFLKMKIQGKLGQVPVIVVFTKYDELITDVRVHLPISLGLDAGALAKQVEENAAIRLEEDCIKPFNEFTKGAIPTITVSTRPRFARKMLPQLVEVTYEHVRGYLKDASIVSAIAQVVSPRIKIDASIMQVHPPLFVLLLVTIPSRVGKKKYWRSLASSTDFPGLKLKKCLDVIHIDIINVWDLNDPHKYLRSREFRGLMSHIVDNFEDHKQSNPNKTIAAGLSMIATLSTIITTLAGPVAPIVLPIAATLVFAKWAFDVYDRSNIVIMRLMAYIVDLTLVMQNIYWLKVTRANAYPVSRRLIKLAVSAYEKSDARSFAHADICDFVETGILHSRQSMLEEIISIVNQYRIESVEMFELGHKMGSINLTKDDEGWNDPETDV